jgi:hypothetical protein
MCNELIPKVVDANLKSADFSLNSRKTKEAYVWLDGLIQEITDENGSFIQVGGDAWISKKSVRLVKRGDFVVLTNPQERLNRWRRPNIMSITHIRYNGMIGTDSDTSLSNDTIYTSFAAPSQEDFKKRVEAMTLKKSIPDLAKELLRINWTKVQCDDMYECEDVMGILSEIEKLPPSQGLRLILEVLEVKSLELENHSTWNDPHNPFKDMRKFLYLESTINNFPTNDYINRADRHPGYNV